MCVCKREKEREGKSERHASVTEGGVSRLISSCVCACVYVFVKERERERDVLVWPRKVSILTCSCV